MAREKQTSADAVFRQAPQDRAYPDDFYSTTNLETQICVNGQWKKVMHQRMDAGVVLEKDGNPYCKKIREIKKGDLVACGYGGIKVIPLVKSVNNEKSQLFSFMGSSVSSEKNMVLAAVQIASQIKEIRARKGRIVFVVGPAVVHTGGNTYLASIIKKGFISAVLSGNATAAHDIESALIGTSLGVSCQTGNEVLHGHRNHIAAINEIFKAGSIKKAVESGVLKSGIFYECVKAGVPFSLAASIRDDGPLPEVITDALEAQKDYGRLLEDAQLVVMLASTLHSVAVGNMLPAHVKTVCVDINPATVTKLSDRGTWQAVGLVTDVGLFLKELDANL